MKKNSKQKLKLLKKVNTRPLPPVPPTKKTPELIDKLMSLIGGGMTNLEAATAVGINPCTIYEWIHTDKTVADKYARMKEISDDIRAADVVKNTKQRAEQRVDPATNRLLYDAERWHISKISPKKYGDRQQLDVEGKQDITVRVLSSGEIEKKEE